MTVIAAFAAIFAWQALAQLGTVLFIVIASWFISLAMEPLVAGLVRRGMRRGTATGVGMLGAEAAVAVLIAGFGGLFIRQLTQLVASIPGAYVALVDWLDTQVDVQLPETGELIGEAWAAWGDDVTSGVLGIGVGIVGGLFIFTSVLLVVYYMVAAGPRFRAAVCRLFAPNRQLEVLELWRISQRSVSDFINSRIVLAALSTAFTFVFLLIISVPYALPLAAFVGLVSQFVPTVGTHIGGALPVAVALASSPAQGLGTLVFIVGYQQVENLIFSPKVSATTMELNPATSFLAVLAFGPIGAFLALPVTATIQAVASTYTRRNELVDSELLREDARASGRWTDVDHDGPPRRTRPR